MVIWGQTVLKERLQGWGFIVYWLVCMGFTGLAFLTALLDFLVIRWRGRHERRRLIDKTFANLVPRDGDRPDAREDEPDSKAEPTHSESPRNSR